MIVFLFHVFRSCLVLFKPCDINCDSLNGALEVKETLEGLDSCATIFGNTAANEGMIGVRE